jgi:hypothetical protein
VELNFCTVYGNENKNNSQMVESDEGTGVEGHSFVSYASLYYRQNQAGNSYLIKKNQR